MTLRHLRIFIEVCRLESITKAADCLNMAQPAVSNAIRELEAFYGVRLFERMNRKIYITNAGTHLRSYADSILTQFDEAKDVIRDFASTTRIRIGSNVSFGDYYLPEIISGFSSLHPEIPLYTMIQNSASIEKCLLLNKLDFAIVDYDNPSSSFFHLHLLSESMSVVCSPDFPYLKQLFPGGIPAKPVIQLRDFSYLPLLLREPGSGSRNTIELELQREKIEPVISVESISTQTLIGFCLKGQGILILPDTLVRDYTKNYQLIELEVEGVHFIRNYYLLHHKSKYFTASMKQFMDYLQQRPM